MIFGGPALRIIFVLGLCSTTMAVAANCAGGGEADDGTGGQAGESTTGSGSPGGGGAAGGGGSAGAGAACSAEPCEVVPPQCGCGPGERCHWDGGPTCVADGTQESSHACEGDCVAGYRCHQNLSGGPAICHQYCRQDDDCFGPGSLCTIPFGEASVRLCSHNCDPVSDTGCAELATKCDVFHEAEPPNRPYTRCVAAGAVGQDEECASSVDCARGLSCFTITGQTGSWCMTWCRVGATVSSCPAGTQCGSFSPALVIGSVEYGACLAP